MVRRHTPRDLRTRSRWQCESARQPGHSSPTEAARVEHLGTRGWVVSRVEGRVVGSRQRQKLPGYHRH